jgi:hypothetical protein
MFRNLYDTELYVQERLAEVEKEIKQQVLLRAARQNRRNFSQRVLSALAGGMISTGANLYRRYGERCARRMALLEQLLDELHPGPPLGQS